MGKIKDKKSVMFPAVLAAHPENKSLCKLNDTDIGTKSKKLLDRFQLSVPHYYNTLQYSAFLLLVSISK